MAQQILSKLGHRMHLINPYRFQPSGGGITDPEDISGLFLWLDGTDTSTMWTDAGTTQVSSDGDRVYRWQNKAAGGSSENFDQTNETYRPAYKTGVRNSLAAVNADGAYDQLTHSSEIAAFESDFTFFVVAAQDSGQTEHFGSAFTTYGNNPTSFRAVYDTRSTPTRVVKYNNDWLDLTSEQSPGWKLISCTYDVGIKIEAFLDGTSQDSATSSILAPVSADNRVFGQSFTEGHMLGHIGEILAYNSILSTSDRQDVETYLMNRWGIS